MSEISSRQRIGIMGGTFDPIHVGHLLVAEQAREQLALSEVRMIPAATSPLKLEQQSADAKHRLEMVQLATGGNPFFTVDDREIRRGGTSYTVDTLTELSQELPEAELVFIMGADSLTDLASWREPQKICQLAFVAVLARGGLPAPDISQLARYLPTNQREKAEQHLLHIPQMEISSSDLRQRIQDGRSIRYQVHPAVEAYIAAHGLYKEKS